jgi:two-component system, response regulator PdtaR
MIGVATVRPEEQPLAQPALIEPDGGASMCFLSDFPTFDPADAPALGQAPRVLVCEDEGLTALRLQRVLKTLGYEVVGEARDGEEAVSQAGRLRPDAILMDVNMPKLDGIQALERIMRECPTTVLMLTAYSEQELVQRALAAGASGYLVKPVVNEQLRPAISIAMARFQQLRQEHNVVASLAEQLASHVPVSDALGAVGAFQIASRFEPASEVARIGGDFFDFIELDNDLLGVVIGDVCGKGLVTATYTTMARHMLRAYCVEDPSPKRVLDRLNRALHSQMSDECPFISMVYGVLDPRDASFTYAGAGHPPPVLWQPEGPESDRSHACRPLVSNGGVIGMFPEREYTEERVNLPPGSLLVMFTDGVTEAHAGKEMLESAGVQQVVEAHAQEPVQAIADAILAKARQFAGGFLRDDVAILVIRNG